MGKQLQGHTLAVLAVVLLACNVVAEKSYYDILGVPKKASLSQIKSAYRRLSREYHPDVSRAPDAQKKFTEISEGTKRPEPSLQHSQR